MAGFILLSTLYLSHNIKTRLDREDHSLRLGEQPGACSGLSRLIMFSLGEGHIGDMSIMLSVGRPKTPNWVFLSSFYEKQPVSRAGAPKILRNSSYAVVRPCPVDPYDTLVVTEASTIWSWINKASGPKSDETRQDSRNVMAIGCGTSSFKLQHESYTLKRVTKESRLSAVCSSKQLKARNLSDYDMDYQ